jgi:hypothetical protein
LERLEVVDHGQLGDTTLAFLDLIGESRKAFRRHRLIHDHAPGLD